MEKELHLFIIWEKGRILSEKITEDIKKHFKIMQIFEVSWPQKQFAARLARFYGKNLPKGCKKERECGCGNFLAILVEDSHPKYVSNLNMAMADAKSRYRAWCGGNYVHASDNKVEGLENIQHLLGLSAEDVYARFSQEWNGRYLPHRSGIQEDLHISWIDRFNGWSRQLLENLNLW